MRIRFLSLGLHILIMLAVAVLAVVILFFWLDHYTRHGDVAEVPDVCGLYYLDADIALSEGGMRSTVIDSMYIDGMEKGIVLDQVPRAGSAVKHGRTIYLTINALSPRKIAVPELRNPDPEGRGIERFVGCGFADGRFSFFGYLSFTGFLTRSDMEDENKYDDDIEFDDGDTRQMYEHYKFVADKGQDLLRIDKFLVARTGNISRNRIQQAAEAGCILVNGKPVKSNYRIKPLDVVSIVMDRPPYENEILPENIPLDVVYEDREVLVVNKPAGLVVHPGHGNYTGTLLNALAYRFRDDPDFDVTDPRLGLVHRIDKDTSGLLVIAKTPEAKTSLGKQFFEKTTQRKYVALVWGRMEESSGRIEGNIGRNPKDRLQMTVFPDGSQGKTAVTHYTVLEQLGYVSLVECRLETGRTHQIRVHMKYIGHTLFNDARYGGNEILKGTTLAKYKQFVHNCFELCPRQALHAKTLGFVHPSTGETLFFDSELPADMTALIDRWRTYAGSREVIG